MQGMHAMTGRSLAGVDHLRQSIIDILTTPLGSRVMRREYGSRLYQLVDAPINRALFVEVYAATAEALLNWEPRFELTRVEVEAVTPGHFRIAVEGNVRSEREPIRLEGMQL